MKMPVVFVGHGTPMNAIEKNPFTEEWARIGKKIKPKAILMVSAHWFTKGTLTQNDLNPKVINDMYGFPKALYDVNYQVRGDAMLTEKVISYVKKEILINNDWGIDHGSWSVLNHMYPKMNIPVVQLSVDKNINPVQHYDIGQQLSKLRDEGVLIIGSGNIVHNLPLVNLNQDNGYDWNVAFDRSMNTPPLS